MVIWNRKENKGVCFDSSTGFTLSDGSVRSPDASWMSIGKWGEISDAEKNQFAHASPDFVIELKNHSDNLKYLTNKMDKWIMNGCSLAWLINPENKTVSIYRKNGTNETIKGFDKTLSGEDILKGFQLNLSVLND